MGDAYHLSGYLEEDIQDHPQASNSKQKLKLTTLTSPNYQNTAAPSRDKCLQETFGYSNVASTTKANVFRTQAKKITDNEDSEARISPVSSTASDSRGFLDDHKDYILTSQSNYTHFPTHSSRSERKETPQRRRRSLEDLPIVNVRIQLEGETTDGGKEMMMGEGVVSSPPKADLRFLYPGRRRISGPRAEKDAAAAVKAKVLASTTKTNTLPSDHELLQHQGSNEYQQEGHVQETMKKRGRKPKKTSHTDRNMHMQQNHHNVYEDSEASGIENRPVPSDGANVYAQKEYKQVQERSIQHFDSSNVKQEPMYDDSSEFSNALNRPQQIHNGVPISGVNFTENHNINYTAQFKNLNSATRKRVNWAQDPDSLRNYCPQGSLFDVSDVPSSYKNANRRTSGCPLVPKKARVEALDEFLAGEDLLEPMEGDVPEEQGRPADLPVGAVTGKNVAAQVKQEVIDPEDQKPKVSPGRGSKRVSNVKKEVVEEAVKPVVTPVRVKSKRTTVVEEAVKPVVTSVRAKSKRNTMKDILTLDVPDDRGKLKKVEIDMAKGRVDSKNVKKMEDEEYDQFCEIILPSPSGQTGKKKQGKGRKASDEDTSNYLTERILRKMHEPVDDQDPAYLVEWIGWNSSSSTRESLANLKGSPKLLKIFLALELAIARIIQSYEGTETPASRQPLLSIHDQKMRYLTDDEWKKEKLRPDFDDVYGKMWKWVEMAREWNKVFRRLDIKADDCPLYLESFHANANLPEYFEYVTQNRVASDKGLLYLRCVEITPPKDCVCTCEGPCTQCNDYFMRHYSCRFEGNKILDVQKGNEGALTLQAVYCREHCCSKKGKQTCRLPRRVIPLLIAHRPVVEGVGVYAIEKIDKHHIICEYTGEMLTKEEADDRDNSYQMLIEGHDVVVDAAKMGNEGRFLNHCCEPNCGILTIHQGTARAVPRLFVFALRDLEQGEELLIDYHPQFSDPRYKKKELPIETSSECHCGAAKCRKRV